MKKKQIINAMRRKLRKYGITKLEIAKMLKAFEQVTTEALLNDDEIFLRGFLRIYATEPKARRGYNPDSGQIETFMPIRKARAKIGKALIRSLNS